MTRIALLVLYALLALRLTAAGYEPGPLQPKETFVANAEWHALDWQPARVVPGSALDFSRFLDAPAGKHGRVIIRNGQFVFERDPAHPLHFYGTVIGHALPYLDRARCEQLADYLAASGYNAVRLHNYIFAKGVMKETGSTEFSAQAEDQLDYFFFCLKKRGLYYTFPINAWGFFKAGDVTDVPEFQGRPFRFESNGLLPISGDAQRWFKEYSRKLLCHVNRYTGLALKDDPALISLELANEDSLLSVLNQYPELIGVYRRLATADLKNKLGRDASKKEIDQELPHSVLRAQEEYLQVMKTYLREMGVQQSLTDLNFRDNQIYALPRAQLDYVDVHSYWALYHVLSDSKDGSYQQNWNNPNASGWSSYLGVTASRLFGKPYMNTEFNSCYPTPYWSFTGPIEAVLAGGQGWNGVFRCGQEANPETYFNAAPVRRISVSNSPIMMMSERIGALLFGQGEVKPWANKIPFVVTPEYLLKQVTLAGGPRYPSVYQRLAFRYQLGTVILDGSENLDQYPCVVVPADLTRPSSLDNKKVFPAVDGLDQAIEKFLADHPTTPASLFQMNESTGSAHLSTQRSETFLLPEGMAAYAGQAVSVAGNKTVAVCFSGSLDGQPLPESKHVLALYLTDLKNTGTEIEREMKRPGSVIIRQPGNLPLLLRQGTVEMNFKRRSEGRPEIWALRYDGSRTAKVEVRKTDNGFAFTARATTSPDTFAAYEIIWN